MNRKHSPKIKDAVDYSLALKPYEHYKLDNGIDVYSVNAGAQEVIQIEMVFYAGNSYEKKKGVAAATNFLLKNGTKTRTALQINEAFEYYGGYCNRACYNETSVISLHSLTKHVDKLLPIVQDMLVDSVFPEEELSIYKQNSLQRLKVNLQKAEFVATRLIDSYIYGEHHPYGVYTNPGDIELINIEECRKFYEDYYLNGNCIIFVSGNFSADFRKQLNQYFGQLNTNRKKVVTPTFNVKPSEERKFRIQNDPNAVQGAIRIAMPFPNRHHPDFKKVMVLNTLYGGFFGSRLMSNIREEKGYTYGIYSYIQNHIGESAWMISTEAGKDVSEATIEEIYIEMKKLREEKIEDDELLLVRNYMIGGILGELDGPFQIMAKWKNIILNEMDESYFYDSINEIKSVTADQLMELSNKYLQPENFRELVVY
ncbi:MAG: pitrilysin family protein [Bacteroidota bacterium]